MRAARCLDAYRLDALFVFDDFAAVKRGAARPGFVS
jgi:hypothetical protein